MTKAMVFLLRICLQNFNDVANDLCGKAPDDIPMIFIEKLGGFALAEGVIFAALYFFIGEIRRFLRDDGMVKVSRTLKENAYKAGRAKEELWGELGREPGLLEIAERTGLSSGEIIMAMESARDVESIYQPVYEKDGDELLMVDQLCEKEENGKDEPEKEAVLNRMVIEQLMELLDEREQNLIRCRYFENRTQSETAKELGMTQVQVSRLEKKILLCLRKNLGSCDS